MTFNALLTALQGFLGRRIVVSLAPLGENPAPVVGLRGVLQRGEDSPVQPILEALGKGVPGDEAIMFRLEPDTQITFRRSQLREAEWLDRGRRVLYVDQAGLIITVCADEDARAIQASVAARDR